MTAGPAAEGPETSGAGTDRAPAGTDGSGAVETVAGRLRRSWRSRGRHGRLRYWLLFRGVPLVVALGAVYLVSGWGNGWVTSYEVMLAIRSPADPAVRSPASAWLLSVTGWLVAPGVAGAVAGYVIGAGIDARRRTPFDALFTEDDDD